MSDLGNLQKELESCDAKFGELGQRRVALQAEREKLAEDTKGVGSLSGIMSKMHRIAAEVAELDTLEGVLHDTKAELGRRLEVARKGKRQAATEAFRPAYDAAKSAFLDAVLTLAAAWGELHAMDRHAQALDGLGPLRGMADLRDALRQVVNRWMCTPGGLSPGQQERAAAVLGELHS